MQQRMWWVIVAMISRMPLWWTSLLLIMDLGIALWWKRIQHPLISIWIVLKIGLLDLKWHQVGKSILVSDPRQRWDCNSRWNNKQTPINVRPEVPNPMSLPDSAYKFTPFLQSVFLFEIFMGLLDSLKDGFLPHREECLLWILEIGFQHLVDRFYC